jgi:hypothetical protein
MRHCVAWEVKMSVEERLAKFESDMKHVLSTLAEVKDDARSLRGELAKFKAEFHSFRTEVAKEFGSVRVNSSR